MADSQVVRNRRSRKHKAGDHRECVPGNCEAVTPRMDDDVTPVVTEPDPPKLGASGLNLWREITSAGPLGPMQRVLLLEACRMADRLDKLDAKLRGEESEWLTLSLPEDGSIAIVIVDKALSEARQQATALKAVIAEIRQASAGSRAPGRPSAASTATKAKSEGGAGGTLSDLTARIAARGGTSTG